MRRFKKLPVFGTRRTRSGFLFRPLMIENKNSVGDVESTDLRWLVRATWVEIWTRGNVNMTGDVVGQWKPAYFVDEENTDDI